MQSWEKQSSLNTILIELEDNQKNLKDQLKSNICNGKCKISNHIKVTHFDLGYIIIS